MPEYLITGRNDAGKRVTDMVKTATAEDALEIMKERGFTDLVLHSDEVTAVLFRPSKFKNRLNFKQILNASRRTPLQGLWHAVRKSIGLYLVIVLVFALGNLALHLLGNGFEWVNSFAILSVGLVVMPAWLFLRLFFFGGLRQSHRRLQEMAGARWDVLLQSLSRGGKIPAHDRAFMTAKALAGLGKLDEGLREYEPYRDCEDIPEWIYWFRRADLFRTGGEHEQDVACLEHAARLSPLNPTVLLTMSLVALRYRHDVQLGRELLTRACRHPISDTTQFRVTEIEGLIALYTNDPARARELLEQSLKELEVNRSNPLSQLMDAFIRINLATALAQLGEREAAERHFRQTEPLLRAHRRNDLIDDYQKAIVTNR
jgi:tetratricopeptide (TPR) repeat protein